MKRAWAILASAGFIVGLGCGDYDARLATTLEDMKYRKRLDDNLIPAPTKGELEKDLIYLRPPLGLQGPTQTFALTPLEKGRFDLQNSFIDQQKQESLHVLVRIKRPKQANVKKTPQPEVTRGEFNAEVVEILRNVYGADLDVNQLKAETKSHGNRKNNFKTKTLDLAAKEVQLYLLDEKNTPYEVALVFEYPKDQHNSISPKIGLCLEAFAVGDLARRSFAGGGDFEGGEAAEGTQGPPI